MLWLHADGPVGWLGAVSPFLVAHSIVFHVHFFTFWCTATFRFISHLPCPRLGTSHFSEWSWFPFVGNMRKHFLSTDYTRGCFWGVFASWCFEQAEQGNISIYVFTCTYSYMYMHINYTRDIQTCIYVHTLYKSWVCTVPPIPIHSLRLLSCLAILFLYDSSCIVRTQQNQHIFFFCSILYYI